MKSIELKSQRKAKQTEFDALMANRKTDMTTEERSEFMAKFNDLEAKIQELDDEIRVAEAEEKSAAKKADREFTNTNRKTDEEKARDSFSLARAFKISYDMERFDGAEKEIHEETTKNNPEWSPEGVAVPANYMRVAPKAGMLDNEKRSFFKYQARDLNVTTPGDGGYTVETQLGELIPVLMPTPIIRNLGATIFSGQSANLDFPRGATRAAAVWEGETDDAAETSPTFDIVQLRPKRLAAYAVESKQLLVQSNIAIEAYLRNLMSEAVSEALDAAAFNGSGVAPVPEGLENITGVGAITTSGIANVNEAKAYEFKTALANAYALKGNLAWVITNTADSTFRQVDLATDIGIRLLGGVAGQQNNNMINYPVFTSDILAADSMIFGNWAELLLAQWGALDIMVNPYSLDISAQVRLTINSWWDVNVKHAASFAMASDLS